MSEPSVLADLAGQITRYGTFADTALESAYRVYHAAADRRSASTCVLVSLIGSLAFVSSDYRLFAGSTSFYVLLAVRVGVLLLSILVCRQLRQNLTIAEYDWILSLWGLLVVTQILYVTSTRPPTYSGHVVMNLSCVFLLYTVVPLALKTQISLAGILSMGCALLALNNGIGTTAVIGSFLGANLLGVSVSRRLHQQGREMFAACTRLEKSLAEVRTLRGLIRVCAWCKKVAVEDQWEELVAYVRDHTHADFTHGICPHCYSEQEKNLGQAESRT